VPSPGSLHARPAPTHPARALAAQRARSPSRAPATLARALLSRRRAQRAHARSRSPSRQRAALPPRAPRRTLARAQQQERRHPPSWVRIVLFIFPNCPLAHLSLFLSLFSHDARSSHLAHVVFLSPKTAVRRSRVEPMSFIFIRPW
jgi:hypothetical protein